ncbi:hypothetical protein [Pseudoalteromonas rubra]|uniref:hypothetical protein n=1 Tax=Pseudoalteromonas rubra TaxID=43658 RepID=UPI000F7B5A36|nr:hypothetical protein [Pseudoalteromonas rubra]
MEERRQHGNTGNQHAAKEDGKTSKLIVRLEPERKAKYVKCGNKHFPVRGGLSAWVLDTLDKQAERDKHDWVSQPSATAVVRDYQRRQIAPDRIETVSQGVLKMWLFNNGYVCELMMGATSPDPVPDQWSVSGGEFVNTYSPQEMADHLARQLL